MGMHLYFDCEHSDAGIRNSVADSCGAVRKMIEKVLGSLYRNVRHNSEPAKGLPQFVRMGMRDGSGYLSLLLEAVGGLNIADTPNKRRHLTKGAEPRKSIYDCTAGEADGITMSLLEAFVDHGWSFSAFDKRDGNFLKGLVSLGQDILRATIQHERLSPGDTSMLTFSGHNAGYSQQSGTGYAWVMALSSSMDGMTTPARQWSTFCCALTGERRTHAKYSFWIQFLLAWTGWIAPPTSVLWRT